MLFITIRMPFSFLAFIPGAMITIFDIFFGFELKGFYFFLIAGDIVKLDYVRITAS
jgi:hypothetical protein